LKQQKHELELQQRLTMADREDGGQSRQTVNRTRKRANQRRKEALTERSPAVSGVAAEKEAGGGAEHDAVGVLGVG
jgi:hypothetical protein